MRCRNFREMADSYLSDELLTETNHDVINHLESCPDCRRELWARRQLRSRLTAAIALSDKFRVREEFADSLRRGLRVLGLGYRKSSRARLIAWLAVAACLALAAGFALEMMRKQPVSSRLSAAGAQPRLKEYEGEGPRSSSGLFDEDSILNATMAQIGETAAGDHRDCAVNLRLLESPIPLGEAGLRYDRAYLNLDRVVNERLAELSSGMQLVESHSCVFKGRRFAHIVLRGHRKLISVLVTDLGRPGCSGKAGTEALDDKLEPPIGCSRSAPYQIACFETAGHAIFIVSDLAEGENLAVARALAPSIYGHISHAEGTA